MLPYLSTRVHHLIHDVGEQKFRVVKLKNRSVIYTSHAWYYCKPAKIMSYEVLHDEARQAGRFASVML
jgi:hypothetical protein